MIRCVELRARLGRQAQETMKRYTWERVAARMEPVLRLATGASGKR
jgi:hypothetical protein